MMHNIDTIENMDAVADKIENTAENTEKTFSLGEEKTYSLGASLLHPEGDFEAVIKKARESTSGEYIIIDLETSEGSLTKFYKIEANGMPERSIFYLLQATGVPTEGFTLSKFVGKTVTATAKHYVAKTGETKVGVNNIK